MSIIRGRAGFERLPGPINLISRGFLFPGRTSNDSLRSRAMMLKSIEGVYRGVNRLGRLMRCNEGNCEAAARTVRVECERVDRGWAVSYCEE